MENYIKNTQSGWFEPFWTTVTAEIELTSIKISFLCKNKTQYIIKKTLKKKEKRGVNVAFEL